MWGNFPVQSENNKGREDKGAGNKNWLLWEKCFPWSCLSFILPGVFPDVISMWYNCFIFLSLTAVRQSRHARKGLTTVSGPISTAQSLIASWFPFTSRRLLHATPWACILQASFWSSLQTCEVSIFILLLQTGKLRPKMRSHLSHSGIYYCQVPNGCWFLL